MASSVIEFPKPAKSKRPEGERKELKAEITALLAECSPKPDAEDSARSEHPPQIIFENCTILVAGSNFDPASLARLLQKTAAKRSSRDE